MSPARVITDEELLQLPEDGNKYEVVDGELVVSPGAGLRHERIIMRLAMRLGPFVDKQRLGEILGSNLLYKLSSGNRRGPDLSFIAAERAVALPPDTAAPDGELDGEDVLPGFRCRLAELFE